jgi:hypothetical protein
MLCSFTVDAKTKADWHYPLDSDYSDSSESVGQAKFRSEWENYLSSRASEWMKSNRQSIARNVGGSKKNKWTAGEDYLLEQTVYQLGTTNWRRVAARIPGRTGKQCRERWTGHRSPEIMHKYWTPEEDVILVGKQAEFGNQWAKIKAFLPGRSSVDVKNRWSWLCRRDVPNHSGEFQEIVKLHEHTVKEMFPTILPAIGSQLDPFAIETWGDAFDRLF